MKTIKEFLQPVNKIPNIQHNMEVNFLNGFVMLTRKLV